MLMLKNGNHNDSFLFFLSFAIEKKVLTIYPGKKDYFDVISVLLIQNHNQCSDSHQIFPAYLRHLVRCLKLCFLVI